MLLFVLALTVSADTLNSSKNLKTTSGLVGLWSFDGKDVVNGVVMDRSGSNANGNLLGPIATSTFYKLGKIGQAFNFDGTDDYVTLGTPAALSSTAEVSLSAWVYVNVAGGNYSIIHDVTAGGSHGQYGLSIIATKMRLSWSNGVTAANFESTSAVESVGTWQHLVAVRSGSAGNLSVTLYVNGVSVPGTFITGGSSTSVYSSLQGLAIGRAGALSLQYFPGLIDDARIYNRALSATEVKALYLAGGGKQNASQNLKLTSGLLGLWSFDGKDVVNGVAMDRSGNGNNGNLGGPVATSTFYKPGKIGQSFQFDGVDDQVKVFNNGTIFNPGTSNFTYSAWVKVSGGSGTRMIIGMYNGGIGLVQFYISGSNFASFVIRDSSAVTSTAAGSTALNDGQWHHVVGVRTGGSGGGPLVYVDGVLVNTGSTGIANVSVPCTTLFIGGSITSAVCSDNPATANESFFNGLIDDVRIYNRALSATEIKALYLAGGGKVNVSQNLKLTSGLVGLWPFDGKDVVNGVAKDRSGSGLDGNLFGPIASSTFYTLGKIGQAFNFDAVNDYVKVTTNGSVYNFGSSNFTFSAWVKFTSSGSRIIMGSYNGADTIQFGISAGNYAYMYVRDTQNTPDDVLYPIGSTALNDGVWHHVVGVKTSTTGASLYVDGVLVNSVTSLATVLPNVPCVTWFIGSFNSTDLCLTVADPAVTFGGSIDDARIYNRALSATEIKALYNTGR